MLILYLFRGIEHLLIYKKQYFCRVLHRKKDKLRFLVPTGKHKNEAIETDAVIKGPDSLA